MKKKNVHNKPKVNTQRKKPSAKSAKEVKHKPEEKYRFLFDYAPIGMGIADLEGNVLDANLSMQEMTGFTLKELKKIGVCATYVNPDERKELLEILRKKGKVRDWEVAMKRRDGNVYTALLNVDLLELDGKKVLLTTARDITERKLVEDKLRLYSEAVENALDGIQITDLNGYIIYSNKAVEKIYGFSPEEYKGRHVNEMNADPEFAGRVIVPSIKEKGQWVGELMVRHKNGALFPIWLTASIVTNNKNMPIALVGIIKDLTERKRIEKALKESEERYRSLFENSPISLWEEDSSAIKKYVDGLRAQEIKDFRKYFDSNPEEVEKCADMVKVVNVNNATLELFKAGSREQLLVGLHRIFTEYSYGVFKKELEAIAEGRTAFEGEDIVKNLRGELMHIYLKWSVAPGHEATYSKRLVSIIDITERKRAEEAVMKYAKQLEEANRMKDLFTDIMHHDLLNPLSIASTYIELLLEQEKDGKKKAYIEAVNKNLAKGIDLMASTTMLSKLGSLESIKFEDMDLKEVIEQVIDNLKPLASKAGMKIESRLMSMPARGNRIIEEVFANLISNAIKYASSGKKILVESEEKKKCWRIKVTDYGEGIKDEYKSLIFDRFQRMEKRGVKGSGLGLAIARKIMELHKGKIWVEDNPEGGAVFVVEIWTSENQEEEYCEKMAEPAY